MTYTFALIVLALFAGGLFAVLKHSEEKKAERRAQEARIRRRYDAAVDAAESLRWPTKPGPKGWRNRRAS